MATDLFFGVGGFEDLPDFIKEPFTDDSAKLLKVLLRLIRMVDPFLGVYVGLIRPWMLCSSTDLKMSFLIMS